MVKAQILALTGALPSTPHNALVRVLARELAHSVDLPKPDDGISRGLLLSYLIN